MWSSLYQVKIIYLFQTGSRIGSPGDAEVVLATETASVRRDYAGAKPAAATTVF